jgi:hypothetical protein
MPMEKVVIAMISVFFDIFIIGFLFKKLKVIDTLAIFVAAEHKLCKSIDCIEYARIR